MCVRVCDSVCMCGCTRGMHMTVYLYGHMRLCICEFFALIHVCVHGVHVYCVYVLVYVSIFHAYFCVCIICTHVCVCVCLYVFLWVCAIARVFMHVYVCDCVSVGVCVRILFT